MNCTRVEKMFKTRLRLHSEGMVKIKLVPKTTSAYIFRTWLKFATKLALTFNSPWVLFLGPRFGSYSPNHDNPAIIPVHVQ